MYIYLKALVDYLYGIISVVLVLVNMTRRSWLKGVPEVLKGIYNVVKQHIEEKDYRPNCYVR